MNKCSSAKSTLTTHFDAIVMRLLEFTGQEVTVLSHLSQHVVHLC